MLSTTADSACPRCCPPLFPWLPSAPCVPRAQSQVPRHGQLEKVSICLVFYLLVCLWDGVPLPGLCRGGAEKDQPEVVAGRAQASGIRCEEHRTEASGQNQGCGRTGVLRPP